MSDTADTICGGAPKFEPPVPAPEDPDPPPIPPPGASLPPHASPASAHQASRVVFVFMASSPERTRVSRLGAGNFLPSLMPNDCLQVLARRCVPAARCGVV